MRAKSLLTAAVVIISSVALVSPTEGAQRQRWPGGESRGNGNGGGGQRQAAGGGGGGGGQRQATGGGDGQRQAAGGGARQDGGGQRQAGERRAQSRDGNGGGRRETGGAPPPARSAEGRQARRAPQQGDPQQPVFAQPDNRQAQSRRPPDIGYVPDIRRGTSDRSSAYNRSYGAQPRVAVPRQNAGRYDGYGNRNGYRVYSPGNKYNNYRYYPYKSYGYARPYYYYPYSFGYGPYGRGSFYFDLYYNSYVFYPPAVARYDYYGSYYGTYGYPTGELRLQVRPRDAQVFIEGAYAGTVDDFDGTFQSLRLEQGEYKVEIVLPGYEPLDFDVQIVPGEKVTYKGDLIPEQQGQPLAEPPRP